MLLISAFLALIAASPSPETPTPRAYVRFCAASIDTGPKSYIATLSRQNDAVIPHLSATNEQVATQAKAYLRLQTAPAVIVRQADQFLPKTASSGEAIILANQDTSAPRWWIAHVATSGTLVDVAPVSNLMTVRSVVGFAREMAAYVVFNDLMGGDASVPPQGCVALFGSWFDRFPGVLPALDHAVAAVPAPDSDLESKVRTAWSAYRQSGPTGEAPEITRETIDHIGSDPKVESVYHDAGLAGDGIGPIDVVRIGDRAHTYVIVGGSKPIKFGGPYCVVGDNRCASYYVWP